MDCEALPDRLFPRISRKAKMDVVRGQVAGIEVLVEISLGRLLNGRAWKEGTIAVPRDSTH